MPDWTFGKLLLSRYQNLVRWCCRSHACVLTRCVVILKVKRIISASGIKWNDGLHSGSPKTHFVWTGSPAPNLHVEPEHVGSFNQTLKREFFFIAIIGFYYFLKCVTILFSICTLCIVLNQIVLSISYLLWLFFDHLKYIHYCCILNMMFESYLSFPLLHNILCLCCRIFGKCIWKCFWTLLLIYLSLGLIYLNMTDYMHVSKWIGNKLTLYMICKSIMHIQ